MPKFAEDGEKILFENILGLNPWTAPATKSDNTVAYISLQQKKKLVGTKVVPEVS